jgi:hypothetical protein|nr:MAG TPA: hypothetical protein [Caudoviricetes sp.]
MIQPLSYRRDCLYRTSALTGTTFIEEVIYYAPDFSFKYHVFLIENGTERKKGYCKAYSAAERILQRFFKESA